MTYRPPSGWGGPSGPPTVDGAGRAWWHDGDGWGADGGKGGSDGWPDGDWYGGDDGWERYPRRRRGRVVRLTGLVVAAALVLGSAGAGVEEVLGGSGPEALPTAGVTLAAVAGAGRVTFDVANTSQGPVTPVCRVAVFRGARQLGRVVVGRGGALAQGAASRWRVSVPGVGPTGDGAQARVTCWT